MRIFVSYARRDHDFGSLLRIADILRTLGRVYIDDLHEHDPAVDRTETVHRALVEAEAFIAVPSEHYPRTPWTRWELQTARSRGIPIRFFFGTYSAPRRIVVGSRGSGSGHE